MKYRLPMLFLAIVSISLSILTIASNNPSGGSGVAIDQPQDIWMIVGFTVGIFLPALILGIFNSTATRVISSIYQILFAIPAFILTLGIIFTTAVPILVFVLFLSTIVITASATTTLCVAS